MFCGGCRRGSCFCLGISCTGVQGSGGESGPLQDQQSVPRHDDAAKGPRTTPPLTLPPTERVNSGRGAGLGGEGVDEKPTISQRRNSGPHLSPSLGKYQGPSSVSNVSLGIQNSRPNSYIDDQHEQGPSNTDISVSTHGLVSHPPENAHSSQLAAKMSPKKKTIAFAKVALQVAAAGLKAAPIPNLDQIPNTLLTLIQTYEVSHLTKIPPR